MTTKMVTSAMIMALRRHFSTDYTQSLSNVGCGKELAGNRQGVQVP